MGNIGLTGQKTSPLRYQMVSKIFSLDPHPFSIAEITLNPNNNPFTVLLSPWFPPFPEIYCLTPVNLPSPWPALRLAFPDHHPAKRTVVTLLQGSLIDCDSRLVGIDVFLFFVGKDWELMNQVTGPLFQFYRPSVIIVGGDERSMKKWSQGIIIYDYNWSQSGEVGIAKRKGPPEKREERIIWPLAYNCVHITKTK